MAVAGSSVNVQKVLNKILEHAKAALTWKEETDKLKEDDAKKFIKIQKKIAGMVIDEYTESAVEQQKETENLEIQASFNTFAGEYVGLLEASSSIKEKLQQQENELLLKLKE